MKDLRFSELLALYGAALTDKQRSATEQYYHFDESLAEIAQSESVSRQAVHAALRQAQTALSELEKKLGFYRLTSAVRLILDGVKDSADCVALREALDKIETLIQ